MTRFLLICSLFLFAGGPLFAQKDAVCDTIVKIYDALDSKDKNVRNQYKINPATVKEGSLGKVTVYKASITVPGFSDPEFIEGGGEGRMYTTYKEAANYEAAVKMWEELNTKFRENFRGNWTFTNDDKPRDLYRSAKLVRDGSLMSPTIRYYLVRSGEKFRLMLEIAY